MSSPLSGRTVVLTRSAEQNREFADLLFSREAKVIELPLIAIEEPEDDGYERDSLLQHMHDFAWIVVTSPNGAERVAPFLAAAIAADDEAPFPRLAVVGAATERSLGRPADLVANPARSAALVQQFPEFDGGSSSSVLVVQGNLADDFLVKGLGLKGWNVEHVVAYRTVQLQPSIEEMLPARNADVLMLASGSAASAWFDAFGANTPPVVISIGPSTTEVAERLGIDVTATAIAQTLDGMLEVAERHLSGE